jgi:chemotaxis protein MotB
MRRDYRTLLAVIMLVLLVGMTGCARQKELDRVNRQQSVTIMNLNDEVQRLNDELDMLMRSRSSLESTKSMLEQRLKEELAKGDLQVEMQDKGLVVTVLNNILFDSGKTQLKTSAIQTLHKVGQVLQTEVPDHLVLIEGHTDTDPIKYSNYKSNWDLSAQRAVEVVHYFVNEMGLNPKRLVASGYGEYQPVAPNTTVAGKSANRRVEIIISPKKLIRQHLVPAS